MKLRFAALLALLSIGGSGCAAFYSDIRANGDGSYSVTYTKQGAFRVYGEVLRCVPQGAETLVCESIDRL
ncbi:MAG: hypothetical protein AAF411_16790 [Myxococcota bacterium]